MSDLNKNWIFLRGLTRGNIHWGNFEKHFTKLNPKAKIEFLEFPGNGYLNEEKSFTNPNELIKYLRNKSQFCKKNESFNLCGISLGGMIALKWAETYPNEVTSVSIINSSLKQLSPIRLRLSPKNYKKIFLALLFATPDKQEEIILDITSNNLNNKSEFLHSFIEFANSHRISKINFFRQLMLASQIQIQKPISPPLKIICSKNDRLVDSQCSKDIKNAFGGNLYLSESAGHDLPLDAPEWLCDILLLN